jgi:signal peptidase II
MKKLDLKSLKFKDLKLKVVADRAHLKIFYVATIVLLIIDQWSKVWAQETLMGQAPRVYLNNFFRFEYAENPGAFLGMGNSLSHPVRFWIFIMFVLVLMIGLAVYVHVRKTTRAEIWAYSLIFCGGVGNLIDRVFRAEGRVIDFMNMGIGSLRTGIFNVADMAIMAGLILLILTTKKDRYKD